MSTLQVYKEEAHLMGNHFELSVVSDNPEWAHDCIQAGINEIQRIEKKLTTFSSESETAKINEMAGIRAVEVSLETIELIERSIKISQITQGAFDITYGSVSYTHLTLPTNVP
jgi:thiamine biosynthesis lipoprotein